MKTIISHAGIFDTEDTSVESIKKCVTNNIGIEIDLRLKNDSVYVSHDICSPSLFFDDVCSCLVNTKIKKALHIKELDAVTPALEILAKHKINNFFLFTEQNHKFKQNDNFDLAYEELQNNSDIDAIHRAILFAGLSYSNSILMLHENFLNNSDFSS